MAFNASQKALLRGYLGFPQAYLDLNSRFESAMDTVGNDSTAQARVEAIMSELAIIDAALATAGTATVSTGTLAKVDEIEWHPVTAESQSVSIDAQVRGRMLINRLAAAFGFKTDELPSLYFSKGSSGGNEIALG
ncbi:MAG TPA: hypothetical protein VGK73_20680 [Polyangiaceae bacterium]